MRSSGRNLTLLGVFAMAAMGPGTRAPAQPSTEGQWGSVLTWPLPPGHMVVLKNGKVLAFSLGVVIPTPCLLFDPVTELVTAEFDGPAGADAHELFCTGHVALADGRIFLTGSAPWAATATLYDPDVDPPGPASWILQDDGSGGPDSTDRFYPTCTLMGDGTVLVTAGRYFAPGSDNAPDTPAIFDPSQPTGQDLQWTSLTGATYADRTDACSPAGNFHADQYPFMFLLTTGETVYAGSDDSGPSQLWSTRGSWTLDTPSEVWTELVPEPQDLIFGGSAVLYRRDKIMKAGGRGDDCFTAIDSVFTLDAAAGNPTWTAGPSMTHARKNHIYLLVLPDGKILATNGVNTAGFVLAPELFDPDDPTAGWSSMAPMSASHPRAHHAVAIMLPDARVLVAGGLSSTAQIFSPPYLFQGPRPTITGSCTESGTMCYGQTVSVMTPDAGQVTAVSLIRPGGTTHGFDFDQRFLDLSFTVAGPGELSVTAPATSNEAPPGYYMLYVLTGDAPSRVPSKARFMLLSSGNGLDCNTNGVPDDCDIAGGTSADCNCNGIPDSCDIATGASGDCNQNGVPDDCESPGGCCLPDGSCSFYLDSCCAAAGGTFQGAETNCNPTRTCCVGHGSCVSTSPTCCAAVGGQSQPKTTLACVSGTGACCLPPFGCCVENVAQGWCQSAGGVYHAQQSCFACEGTQGPVGWP